MKLTINRECKTIEVDANVNLNDLVNELKSLVGDDWDKYELITATQFTYYPVYPVQPWPNLPTVIY